MSQNAFPQYNKVHRIDKKQNHGILENGVILIQEKMDGANFRFTLENNIEEEYHTEGRELVFGSRRVTYKNEKDVDKSFIHAIEYIRENIDTEQLKEIQEQYDGKLVVYGEAMHKHTLEYGEPQQTQNSTTWRGVPNFLGFDIHHVTEDGVEHLDYHETDAIFDSINIPTVPEIYYGMAEDLPDDLHANGGIEFPQSEYRDGLPEGVVIKNEKTGQIAKIRTEKFKEKHGSQSVTNPDTYEPSDSVVLARQYATQARILKIIHKYEDRGKSVDNMGVMEDLWRSVFDDIISEEYDTIFLENHTIDTKEFRSEIASNTASVLQQYLDR